MRVCECVCACVRTCACVCGVCIWICVNIREQLTGVNSRFYHVGPGIHLGSSDLELAY